MISRQRLHHRRRKIRKWNRLFPRDDWGWCELGLRRCSCWMCRGVKSRDVRQQDKARWRKEDYDIGEGEIN